MGGLVVKDSKNLWIISPILILLNNIFAIYQNIYLKPFSEDEFQHVHNAWNQFNGLMIYRDFFDHHGPIYTLLNSFILTKINEPASFDTLIIFRHSSFFTSLLIFILVFLIAKFLLKTISSALLTTMVFTMWHIIQATSIEIRPDLLQSVFALLGFYLFVINQKTTKVWVFVLSGCLFGLMLCCNFKSIILLLAIFLFLLSEYYQKREARSLQIGLFIAIGVSLVYLVFGIYFYSQGALNDFLYYTTIFNFSLAGNRSYAYIGMQLTSLNFLKDFLLCSFTLLGLFSMQLKSSQTRLLLLCTLLPIYGCFKGFFPYYCIIFLPFMSIFTANGVNNYLIKRKMSQKKLVILLLLGLAIFTNNIKKVKSAPDLKYLSQKNTLDFALQNFSREAKIATYHRACPAYVFNKDIDYFWFENSDISRVTGRDPFVVKEGTEPAIIVFLDKVYDPLNNKKKSYLQKHYQSVGPGSLQCIWLKGRLKH